MQLLCRTLCFLFGIWQSAIGILFRFPFPCRKLAVVLQRRSGSNGVVYYASSILEAIGVRHAFSTRIGGISPPPFDSLNLGNPNGCDEQDDYARIWRNYALLLACIECPTEPPLRVHQVHGSEVSEVHAGKSFDTSCGADALVSGDHQRPISVRTADCVPILLSSGDGRIVAAVHAGWRGIVAGVIPAAVKRMKMAGKPEMEIRAAIGPCIGMDAFEVGAEVLAEFEKVFGRESADGNSLMRKDAMGKGHVDLRGATKLQLLSCGIAEHHIDPTDRCTVAHRDEFFSHRRDHGITGRMAAIIAASALERG